MKTLENFDFGSQVGRSSYDWDSILNGEINVLVAGEDFDCKPQTVKQRARQVAEKMGLKVRTGTKDGNIVIQAYEMTDEEKKFAAAKAKNKNKKAKAADTADDVEDEAQEAQETPTPKRRRKAS